MNRSDNRAWTPPTLTIIGTTRTSAFGPGVANVESGGETNLAFGDDPKIITTAAEMTVGCGSIGPGLAGAS